MPWNIGEKWNRTGALGKNGQQVVSAIVTWTGGGTPDTTESMLLCALPHFATVSDLGFVFADFQFEEQAAGNAWIVSATYKPATAAANRQTGDASFSFKAGGGNQHITTSIDTVNVYGPGPNQPSTITFHGQINVDSDGTVHGVDIRTSNFSFKTTFFVDPVNMTGDYLNELKYASGKVNSDVVTIAVDGIYMTLQPGELFLNSIDGSKRIGFGDWEISLNWDEADNLTNLTIGDLFSGVNKRGWDYLWVYHGTPNESDYAGFDGGFKGALAHGYVVAPSAVFIEQVYEYTPMSGILPPQTFGISNRMSWLSPALVSGGGFNQ